MCKARVDLSHFGNDLCKGRPNLILNLTSQALRQSVHMDSLVCNIILDNAISNAMRHRAPGNPQVKLDITVTAADSDPHDAPVSVQFLVTNHTDSRNGRIQRWTGKGPIVLTDRPEHQQAPTSLSDGIGLKHVVMAAKLGNVDVELWQEDDLVFFKAVYKTTLAQTQSSQLSPTYVAENVTLPDGLQIVCIDDSSVARTGLQGLLPGLIAGSTVSVFGKTMEEVDPFIAAALTGVLSHSRQTSSIEPKAGYPQHCTPGVLHGTHQPLWNTPPPPIQVYCR